MNRRVTQGWDLLSEYECGVTCEIHDADENGEHGDESAYEMDCDGLFWMTLRRRLLRVI